MCPLCRDGSVEDEVHFFINCESLSDIRRELFAHMTDAVPNFLTLTDMDKFICIMTSEVRQVARSS